MWPCCKWTTCPLQIQSVLLPNTYGSAVSGAPQTELISDLLAVGQEGRVFLEGPSPHSYLLIKPYLQGSAFTKYTSSRDASRCIHGRFHERAVLGCSWRKWPPLAICASYCSAQNSKCSSPSFSFSCMQTHPEASCG